MTPSNDALRGRQVDVTLIRENGPDEALTVTADPDGRLRIDLLLGPARTGAERRLGTRQGLRPSPRTRVRIALPHGVATPMSGQA